MTRPPKMRTIRALPGAVYFKPRGIPLRVLSEVVIGLDELEAMRLADLEGLSHEETGQRMNVSRQTVGRILEEARRKVADALVNGKAMRLEGGPALPAPGMGFGPGGPGGPGGGGQGRRGGWRHGRGGSP